LQTKKIKQHRLKLRSPPVTGWEGDPLRLPINSRVHNADGSLALSQSEHSEQLLELAHVADGGTPKTARRFYYLALLHGYIRLDMGASDAAAKARTKAYKRITDVLVALQLNGRLAWDAVLELTHEIAEPLTFRDPRDAQQWLRGIYDEDRWLGQPFYPLLIVEKDTMEPICRPLARRWQILFVSSRGYGSLKLQHDIAQLLNRRQAETGQPAHILFVSDLDPSGLDLQRMWQDALGNFNVACTFHRIGLTMEQVTAHDLGALGIAVKPSDSRAKRYIENYGTTSWEADVLPASVIKAAIDAAIEERLNEAIWKQRNVEIERARFAVTDMRASPA
jgi:hypothetical protein